MRNGISPAAENTLSPGQWPCGGDLLVICRVYLWSTGSPLVVVALVNKHRERRTWEFY